MAKERRDAVITSTHSINHVTLKKEEGINSHRKNEGSAIVITEEDTERSTLIIMERLYSQEGSTSEEEELSSVTQN